METDNHNVFIYAIIYFLKSTVYRPGSCSKYFKQEPIQRRFDFSGVLYFGWPKKPSSGTMRVYIELLLCTYI